MNISPDRLRDYLMIYGWEYRIEGLKRGLYVFENPDFPRCPDLIYPMDAAAPDYEEAVEQVFRRLANNLGRSIEQVLSEFQSVNELKFENCPFELIFQAFRQLWPDIEVRVVWAPSDCLDGALGRCSWDETGRAFVEISFGIPVAGACDILCHELAHAAVSRGEVDIGPDYHSPEWHQAYQELVRRYRDLLDQDTGESVCQEVSY